MLSQFFILRTNASSALVAPSSSFQKPGYSGTMHEYAPFLSKKPYHLALLSPGLVFEIMNQSVFGAFANTTRCSLEMDFGSDRLFINEEIGLSFVDGGNVTMNFCSNSIRASTQQ